MPRTKNPEIGLRNDQIYAEWRGGRSLSWLAAKYDRTPQQMGRIVADRHPDLDDDTDRSLHRGRLEGLYEEVQSLVDNPGWKLTANGKLAVGENDEPLYDTAAKIEALKLKLMILESARKLDARDKPQKKPLMDPEAAWRDAQAALTEEKARIDLRSAERRELEEYRQKFGRTIPGEVLAELPPADPQSAA